jgi:hypothetical protein
MALLPHASARLRGPTSARYQRIGAADRRQRARTEVGVVGSIVGLL